MLKEFIRTSIIVVKKTNFLVKWMEDSTHIYNDALYELRKAYFKCLENNEKFKTPTYCQLYKIVKSKDSFVNSDMDYNVKQQIIRQVSTNWTSFIKATVSYNQNPKKFRKKPQIPDFLDKTKLNLLTIDKSIFRKKDKKNHIIVLPKTDYKVKFKSTIDVDDILCIRILNFYSDKLKLEIVYKKCIDVDEKQTDNFIGIDLGVNNLCAITSNNQNFSWIVNGGIMKSINQYTNKKISKFCMILDKCNHKQKTSKKLKQLRMKRDNKINYYLNCVSRFIVDLCIDNNISNIVIGSNKNWKQNANRGKKNNQNFCYIPFNKLIWMIQYKAEEYGISVIKTEESYTSKTDHLIKEEMVRHDVFSGRRIKRGLFKSSTGKIINSDINGAIGILRKKDKISDAELFGLRNRGDIVSPLMFPNKTHKEKYFIGY